jgi:hypothetical protein
MALGHPLETEWLPVRWELFEAQAPATDFGAIVARVLVLAPDEAPLPVNALILTEDAPSEDFLYEEIFANVSDVTVRMVKSPIAARNIDVSISSERDWRSGRKDLLYHYSGSVIAARREVRRLVHNLSWGRKDPVTQLPPGATNKISHSITTGLSAEHSRELAQSLGLNFGSNLAGIQTKLSSQLQQKFELRVEFSVEEKREAELTLINPSDDRYKLFAMWHVDHLIKVDALSAPLAIGASDDFRPIWTPRGHTEFVTESEPHTYADVSRF